MIQTACPKCRGEGTSIAEPCPNCRGRGVERKISKITVTIPPGVDEGQQLRLGGKGEVPPGGGQPGNLYVVLDVEADERFVREGVSILTEARISYITAALGGEVQVPTLEDQCEGTTMIDVPAGTQPGDVVVRRGEGIRDVNGRGRGDHVVQFTVEIPKKLSDRERDLLKELAAESSHEVKEKRGFFRRK
jgi:molecular chaperone DnaJ